MKRAGATLAAEQTAADGAKLNHQCARSPTVIEFDGGRGDERSEHRDVGGGRLGELRGFFTALFGELPAGFFDAMKMSRQEIVGEVAYILWERRPITSQATDTFFVRNGKILLQTFTAATQ